MRKCVEKLKQRKQFSHFAKNQSARSAHSFINEKTSTETLITKQRRK